RRHTRSYGDWSSDVCSSDLALNATIQYQIVTSADYPVKLGTVMAGNDLPDLIYMYSRPGASSTLAAAAGVPQFLQSQAADLTPRSEERRVGRGGGTWWWDGE